MKKLNFILAILLIFTASAFSQKKDLVKDGTKIYLQKTTGQKDPQNTGRDELNELKEKIRSARTAGNVSETERLNDELNQKTGITPSNGESVPVFDLKYGNSGDNLSNNTTISLISDQIMIYNEFATLTEQIGPTKGRIWAFYKWKESGGAYADPMHCTMKYSDNGGILWNHYLTFSFTSAYFNPGNYLDVEFLYNSLSNKKKIFVVLPIEGSFNQTNMGLLSVNADTINPVPVFNKYAWTSDSTHTYHSSKLTSDNVNYQIVPYLYFCSAEINQSFHNTLRTAVCMNPFSPNPTLTMNPGDVVPVRNGFFYDQFDYCYYQNFNDSLVLVMQSQTDKRVLDVYRTGSNITGSATYSGGINTLNKTQNLPKIASDGSKNIMIITYFDYSATDEDVMSYSSSNGAVGPYSAGSIATSTDNEVYPQVEGKYFSNGSFYCSALKKNATSGSMIYRSSSHNVWNTYYQLQNDSLSGYNAYDSRPGFRFVNDDSCFAVWSGSGKLYSSAGCNSSGNYTFTKNLQLKVFIEGPYNAASNQMLKGDTLRIYIRETSAPYNIVDSSKGAIDKNGTGYFTFANVSNNINYYIVVKSRNIIETWSKTGGEKFLNNSLNFDFTSGSSQAYGANEKQIDDIPASYGVFSGDVIQDKIINLSDIIKVYNDAEGFSSGYPVSDLDGNGITGLSDIIIVYNNSSNFVKTIRP